MSRADREFAGSFTADFAVVEAAEQQWLNERREVVGGIAADAPTVGLALSGGGIRSASFNLGLLQGLQEHGLLSRVDYLSTVSGGGYIGSCFSYLRNFSSSAKADVTSLPLAKGGSVLDWLRAHGSYLIDGRGISGWSLVASIGAGTLLNLLVLLPLFLGLIAALRLDIFALAWPEFVHLPGAAALAGHDGFLLLALSGVGAFALYGLSILLFAFSTVLPPMRRWQAAAGFRRLLGRLLAVGCGALAIGLLPVVAGLEQSVDAWLQHDGARTLARHLTWAGPLLAGLAGLWRSGRSEGSRLALLALSLLIYGLFGGLYVLAGAGALWTQPWFLAGFALSLVLALSCDVNAISMHSYYRSRLAEAYLPPAKSVPAAGMAQFRLTELTAASGAPLHLINTTLNTSSSKQEKLRSRNGENLVLSALYCGSTATGYRHAREWLRGGMTLSTALSVSGAAVDPDMYATKARPISFLMSLLNIRLGIWTLNPASQPRRWRWPAWYQLMLREMLGVGLSETQTHVHLADGGHFENLGLYELVRRRCCYLIVGDAGADPDTTMADLGKLVQRVRADFGAEIAICADAFAKENEQRLPAQAHLLGTVRYADGTSGELLYIKAALRAGLSADIYGYWRSNPAFPNQSTADQFFDEQQFDAYRELGRQLTGELVSEQRAGTGTVSIESAFARARQLLVSA